MNDSPLFQLIPNFPGIDLPDNVTETFKDRLQYVEEFRQVLVSARSQPTREEKRDALLKIQGDLGDLKVVPRSVLIELMLSFRDAEAFARIKGECRELTGIAAAIDCPYVVLVPGKFVGGATRDLIIDESVKVLNELADIASERGVSLAFEFLGQTDCSVQTLDLAHEIIDRVDRDEVGLVIDAFHFYAGGSTIDMIEALDPKRLFIFHIDDAEDRPRRELTDAHRLLPGLGTLPLAEIIAAFRRIGYDSNASVELFRPEYWERDPFELAREAQVALQRVLA